MINHKIFNFFKFFLIFIPFFIFMVAVPVIFLATKPFVSLQYALLPNKTDQKILAQESLTALNSWHDSATAKSRFEAIKQSNQILPLYTPLEVDHLVDVKIRFDVVRIVAIASFILLLVQAFVIMPMEFAKKVYSSSVVGLFVVTATGVMLLISWNWFFVTFHEVLFPAGNWRFSETSGLIQLFPEVFWFRFGLAWIGTIQLIIVALTLISKRIIKQSSPN